MATAQHLAVRVSDIARSTKFYVEALGGKEVLRPYSNNPQLTENFFGVKDTEYVIAYIELPDGFGIELFQFIPEPNSTIGVPQTQASFMHFALHVDNMDEALARAEAAGGQRFHDPGTWSSDPARFVYLKDPDGNIIEFNETTWGGILTAAVELHPEAAP